MIKDIHNFQMSGVQMTPAIPANEFLTLINSKRLIKPTNPTDFKTTNIVVDHARNNSQSRSNKNCCLQVFFETVADETV